MKTAFLTLIRRSPRVRDLHPALGLTLLSAGLAACAVPNPGAGHVAGTALPARSPVTMQPEAATRSEDDAGWDAAPTASPGRRRDRAGGGQSEPARQYRPTPHRQPFVQRGLASWYGAALHGRRTANGERFNMKAMTAAHRSLPLPSWVRVTNLANGRSIVVRINDRGPYAHNRIVDLSHAAASQLDLIHGGVGQVMVERVEAPAS